MPWSCCLGCCWRNEAKPALKATCAWTGQSQGQNSILVLKIFEAGVQISRANHWKNDRLYAEMRQLGSSLLCRTVLFTSVHWDLGQESWNNHTWALQSHKNTQLLGQAWMYAGIAVVYSKGRCSPNKNRLEMTAKVRYSHQVLLPIIASYLFTTFHSFPLAIRSCFVLTNIYPGLCTDSRCRCLVWNTRIVCWDAWDQMLPPVVVFVTCCYTSTGCAEEQSSSETEYLIPNSFSERSN